MHPGIPPKKNTLLSLFTCFLLIGTACSENDESPAADAGPSDAEAILVPTSGLYRMSVKLVEVGDTELQFQASLQSNASASQIDSIDIRAIGSDGSLSEILVTETDIPIADNAFEATFENFTIPAAYSLTGGDIVTTFTLHADIQQSDFFCGGLTGDIPTFAITLEQSTFGAIPWQDSGQTARSSCAPATGDGTQEATIGGPRPATLYMPEGHSNEPLPLVVLLHGFGVNGATQDAYFGLSKRVAQEKFLLAIPDGTENSEGKRFWNATLCCDFENNGVDDVAYILSLIDEAIADYGAIPSEVHLIGHSNGGFMASRIACDAADKINSFVSFAGSSYVLAEECQPSKAVNKLHIHGTMDETIPYTGGDLGPGAETLAARWAGYNGCDNTPLSSQSVDLITDLAGAETSVSVYQDCDAGGDVQLWTIANGTHAPMLQTDFADIVLPFMLP